MKAGEISIDLTINDHDFSVKLKNGEKIMSQFARQMETTAKSAQVVENHFSSLSTRFRHFMIMVASTRFALLDINQVFLSLPRSIIQVTGEMERLTKLMEGLSRATSDLARKQEALASVKFVYAMGKEAPFAISALTDAFVKLKSGGIDPMNGSMQSLVDSVAKFGGDAQKLSRASIAIQQMAGKGVISMEELRQQLGEAIPNAIEMMAVGSGKSMSKLVKEVSKGQVEAASALERMFAVMRFRNEGAAAAMMTTWSGMLERLKTEWQLAQIEMGKSGGFEAAKDALSSIIDSFDGAQMRQLGSDLGYVTNQMVQAIGALIRGAQQYYEYIKLAGQAFISYFVASRVASAGAVAWGLMQAQHAAAVKEINRANEESYRQSVQLHEKEVSSARAKYARIQAELGRHVQAVLAAENRVGKVNAAATTTISEARNIEAQARAVDLRTEAGRRLQVELQREAAALRANAASMQSLTAATVQARNAHYEKANVLKDTARQQSLYIQQLNNTVVSQNKVTGAQKAWATVSRGLGSVFNALGGWLTVVSVALAFGVSKWMDYAQAAERAAQRAKDAAAGISSAKALTDAQEELGDVQSEMAGFGRGLVSADEGRRNKAKEEIEKLKKRESQLNEEIKLHRENLAEDSAQHQEKLYLREFDRNSEALKRHYRTLALTEEDEIRKQSEKKLAAATSEKEKQAIRDKQQKDIAELTRRNAVGVTKDVLTYNEGALQDANERLKNATDKDRLALEKVREYHETAIADAKARLQTAEKIGSDYNLLFDSGAGGGNSGGASGEKKTTALEQLLDRVADKLATINGELDKKGSGDLQKIISDLEQIDPSQMIANGKRMTKEEVIEMIMPGLIEGEWRLDFEKSFEQISDTVGDEMIRVTTELDGGRSTIERLRNELNELGLAAASAGDPERVGRITGMIGRLEELQEKQSELSFKGLSADFVDAIDQVRSSLSDDPSESLYAAWTKDVKSYEQAIVKAKLSTEDASKAQEQFAEYVRLTYERLQRDLEPPIMQLARDWANTTEEMGNAIADWASDASEALTDFVMEGKADFASLAKSIIRDLVRIQIQAAMGATIKMAYPTFQAGAQPGGYSGYAKEESSSSGFGMPSAPGMDMMSVGAKGLSWLGGATGMTGLTSFAAGMGMTSYTSAAAMTGLAEAGLVSGVTSGAAASAGSLLGAVSAAAPYVAAAVAIASMLGAFDKKPSDKTSAATYDISKGAIEGPIWDMGGKKAASQEQKDANAALSMLVGGFAKEVGLDGQLVTAMGGRDGTRLAIEGGFKTPNGEVAGGSWLGDKETAYNYGNGSEAIQKMLDDLIDEGTLSKETIDRWKSLQANVDGSARDAVELVDTLALINQGLSDTEILRADLIQVEGETLGQTAARIRDINSAMDPLTANEVWVKGMGDLADIFYDVGLELPHTNSEFLSLIDSLDLTTQAGQDAYRALIGVAPAFSNVAQVVMSALDSISKTTADSIRDIEMSLLDDEGKYSYLDDELEGLVTSLKDAFDPAEITSLVEQINSKTLEAWNLLDETQKQQVGTEFLDRIRYAEEISKDRLDPEAAVNADKSEKEKEESDSVNKAALESATAQKEAAAATASAATAHASAASALLSAAQALSSASDRLSSGNTDFSSALSSIGGALSNLSLSEIGGR